MGLTMPTSSTRAARASLEEVVRPQAARAAEDARVEASRSPPRCQLELRLAELSQTSGSVNRDASAPARTPRIREASSRPRWARSSSCRCSADFTISMRATLHSSRNRWGAVRHGKGRACAGACRRVRNAHRERRSDVAEGLSSERRSSGGAPRNRGTTCTLLAPPGSSPRARVAASRRRSRVPS
jgi:hypothetical protein